MIAFRPALTSDISFLLELRRLTMTTHETAAGIVRMPVDVERRALEHFESARIIEWSTTAIGMLKLTHEGSEWYLSQIQLLPAWQRRGLGTEIVQGVLADATESGAAVSLSVLKVSPAVRLYERLGFSVVTTSERGLTLRFDPNAAHRDAAP